MDWLETDMARHMLVEFPLLMALGATLAQYTPLRIDSRIGGLDRYGLTGWTFASLVIAFWMIPAALDAALGAAVVNLAKYASLVAAGFALRSAMRRSPVVLEAFFVGNFAWMSLTVGLVYQTVETQLCLNYLADSQQRAGLGLVSAAIASLIAWTALRPATALRSASAAATHVHDESSPGSSRSWSDKAS